MSRWIPTAPVMLAALALQIWGVSDATAQVSAYLLTPAQGGCQSGCTGTITAVDVDGRQVLWAAPIPAAFGLSYGGVYTAPDGRYVAWQGLDARNGAARYVGIFDVASRATATVALSTPNAGLLPPMMGNPLRTELYTVDASGPIVLSPAGIRPLTCTTCGGSARVESISANGRRVMYSTASATVVFDTDTGAVVSELVLSAGSAALSRTGDEIYLASDTLRRHRATDGQLQAEVTLPVGGYVLRVDPRTGDVFLVRGGMWLATYAETSLAQHLAETFVPW